ncbi:MAG: nuclear transport factor 2 family protein [Desulfobacterium sp.]|nr:nuclear transport factor 2 family protein [Desulfobacterium sp.]MBU3947882.1 nuclear transport factor 2 family protein [Pseudomonadota bacterium]MBU4009756.1 nuclear transport factor 2 family protein [Pseudomonadota bacterium]MBU4034848.1 nuclear transport factor 2 family protein [Pseudomonadota bacterium]
MNDVLIEKDLIHETIANYCFYFDGAEFDKWVGLFTDDGIFDCGALGLYDGKEAIKIFTKNIPLTNGLPMMKHCIMNEVIKVSGNSATANSYLLMFKTKTDGSLVISMTGRYEDELVRHNDRWLFKKRKLHIETMGDMS